jgi:hypothetical protein
MAEEVPGDENAVLVVGFFESGTGQPSFNIRGHSVRNSKSAARKFVIPSRAAS